MSTDHVDAETPLLDAEALRPSYEHEQRRLLREIEEGRRAGFHRTPLREDGAKVRRHSGNRFPIPS